MILYYISWDINPVLVQLGPVAIRWYGLLWAIGIYATLIITQHILLKEKHPQEWVDKLFLYTVLGAVIGARLGHCFFYEWKELLVPMDILGMKLRYWNPFISHPWELLYVWRGGLASHGGAIGIVTAIFLYDRKVSKKGIVWVFDRLVIGVAICGASIRLGNLMNSEIYGGTTTLPWGFIFLSDPRGDGLPHHPTQIYEMLYCLLTFAILWVLYKKYNALQRPGLIYGIFLLGIFGTRFVLEFIKQNQEDFESGMLLNMGQLLSVPFVIWGIWLLVNAFKNSSSPKNIS